MSHSRLIRKKELQLRRRATQPSPQQPAQAQQGAPAQASGKPLPGSISASSNGPFAVPAYVEPPALLYPFDVDDGGSGAEDDPCVGGGRGGTSPDTASAAGGAQGVRSPVRRDASRGLAGGYVGRLLAGYDEYDSMYGNADTDPLDEWLPYPYPYPYGAAWFDVAGYEEVSTAAPEHQREQQAEGAPAVDGAAAAQGGHVADDASPGRRRGRRPKVGAVESDGPGVGAAVQGERPQEAVQRGRRRRLPLQPDAAQVLDKGDMAGGRPALAPGGNAGGAVGGGEQAVQADSGTAALAAEATRGRTAQVKAGVEDEAAGLEEGRQRAREHKTGGRGSRTTALPALGGGGGPSSAPAAEARRRRMEELKVGRSTRACGPGGSLFALAVR